MFEFGSEFIAMVNKPFRLNADLLELAVQSAGTWSLATPAVANAFSKADYTFDFVFVYVLLYYGSERVYRFDSAIAVGD